VPVAVQEDALAAARYRAFILPRLMGSLAALAGLPVYLVLRGVPNEIEIAVFSWLVTPILIVYFLVRTGRYQAAHILSCLLRRRFPDRAASYGSRPRFQWPRDYCC
jgi:cell cycle sensor histidine kinase DivJ